jgi:hypothetical protein
MFIDFFTNSIEANEVLLAERGVPISSKVQQALKPKLGRSQAEMFAYLERVSKDVQPIPPADPPGHTEIVKNVYDPQVVEPVAFGRLAPDKAAALLRVETVARTGADTASINFGCWSGRPETLGRPASTRVGDAGALGRKTLKAAIGNQREGFRW